MWLTRCASWPVPWSAAWSWHSAKFRWTSAVGQGRPGFRTAPSPCPVGAVLETDAAKRPAAQPSVTRAGGAAQLQGWPGQCGGLMR